MIFRREDDAELRRCPLCKHVLRQHRILDQGKWFDCKQRVCKWVTCCEDRIMVHKETGEVRLAGLLNYNA